MAESEAVARAAEDARRWVSEMGPGWVASFDQMHCDVRKWAEEVGVDPSSYEFRAAWCVATTFLHGLSKSAGRDSEEGGSIADMANILATVGLWGSIGNRAPTTDPFS